MSANYPSGIEDRLEEFLRPSRIAVVATVGKAGFPQLTPNWYSYVDRTLFVSTTKERFKYINLKRDPRLTICIYSGTLASQYVVLRGEATIIDGESIWTVTRGICERYVSPNKVAARMRMLRTENRVLIALKPDRISFRD